MGRPPIPFYRSATSEIDASTKRYHGVDGDTTSKAGYCATTELTETRHRRRSRTSLLIIRVSVGLRVLRVLRGRAFYSDTAINRRIRVIAAHDIADQRGQPLRRELFGGGQEL